MQYPIRIILVEDHQLFRLGLTSALSSVADKYEIVGEAGTAEEFFEIINKTPVDLVILDVHLPDKSGVQIAKELAGNGPAVKILVLSAENDAKAINALMEAGINGFISKNSSITEVMTAIDYIMDGAEYFGKDISKVIRDIKTARDSSRQENFTERENEIIELCSEGLTAKEIADKLNINVATVNTHKNNIFKKLGINNSVELVRYALKAGIITI